MSASDFAGGCPVVRARCDSGPVDMHAAADEPGPASAPPPAKLRKQKSWPTLRANSVRARLFILVLLAFLIVLSADVPEQVAALFVPGLVLGLAATLWTFEVDVGSLVEPVEVAPASPVPSLMETATAHVHAPPPPVIENTESAPDAPSVPLRQQHDPSQTQTLRSVAQVLLHYFNECVFVIDEFGVVLDVNEAVQGTLGYTRADLVGNSINCIIADPYIRAQHDGYLEAYRRTGRRHIIGLGREVQARHRDGSVRDVDLAVTEAQLDGQRVFMGVLRDLTQRREIERTQTLLKARNEFVAAITHEMRAPLNAVVSVTRLLADTPLTAEQRELVHTVRSGGDALLTFVNDFLDLSRLEANKLRLDRTEFDLHELLDVSVELSALAVPDRSIDIVLLVDRSVPRRVLGDPARVRQLLVNTVGNAIKFTRQGEVVVRVEAGNAAAGAASESGAVAATPPPGGHGRRKSLSRDQPVHGDAAAAPSPDSSGPRGGSSSSVSAVWSPYELHVTVRDTGIGIDPARLPDLFRAYAQVHRRGAAGFGGTGLGLAICKQLCERMGGQISLRSDGEGCGTTCEFSVCVAAVPPAPCSPGLLGSVPWGPSHPRLPPDAEPPLSGVALFAPPVSLAGKRALIIVPGHTLRTYLVSVLQQEGMVVQAFATLPEAKRALQAQLAAGFRPIGASTPTAVSADASPLLALPAASPAGGRGPARGPVPVLPLSRRYSALELAATALSASAAPPPGSPDPVGHAGPPDASGAGADDADGLERLQVSGGGGESSSSTAPPPLGRDLAPATAVLGRQAPWTPGGGGTAPVSAATSPVRLGAAGADAEAGAGPAAAFVPGDVFPLHVVLAHSTCADPQAPLCVQSLLQELLLHPAALGVQPAAPPVVAIVNPLQRDLWRGVKRSGLVQSFVAQPVRASALVLTLQHAVAGLSRVGGSDVSRAGSPAGDVKPLSPVELPRRETLRHVLSFRHSHPTAAVGKDIGAAAPAPAPFGLLTAVATATAATTAAAHAAVPGVAFGPRDSSASLVSAVEPLTTPRLERSVSGSSTSTADTTPSYGDATALDSDGGAAALHASLSSLHAPADLSLDTGHSSVTVDISSADATAVAPLPPSVASGTAGSISGAAAVVAPAAAAGLGATLTVPAGRPRRLSLPAGTSALAAVVAGQLIAAAARARNRAARTAQLVAARAAAQAGPPIRVLAADDSPVNRKVLSLLLTRLKARFVMVSDGQEAVEAACAPDAAFDAVLLDLHMPRLDGGAAARQIRAHFAQLRERALAAADGRSDAAAGPSPPACPVLVMITGDAAAGETGMDSDTPDELQSLSGVLDAALVKPVLLQDLQDALSSLLPGRIAPPAPPRRR